MSPCLVIALPGGGRAIVRTARRRCSAPGCAAEGTLLCDWPLRFGKTCDAPVCRAHARHVGPDRDLCPAHRAQPWPPGQEVLL